MLIISPSILACDFSNLETEVKKAYDAGAQWLHIDVMDGHFVPNITLGPDIVKSIRNKTRALFDVHLMISDPLYFVESFANAGADLITFHIESDSNPQKTIDKIKELGKMVGISVKPNTAAKEIEKYIDEVDLVLVMTVEPGFGGQKFMQDMLPKVREISEMAKKHKKNIYIEVDGGISSQNAALVRLNGANVLVAGSAIFSKPDYKDAINEIIKASVL